MFSDRDANDAARLDELWDDFADQPTDSTEPFARFIHLIEEGAPTMTQPQRERVLGKVQFPASIGAKAIAVASTAFQQVGATMPRIAEKSVDVPRLRRRKLEHPVLQIAATILLLIGMAGAWFVARPDNTEEQSSPGIAVGSPSTEDQSQSTFLASLEVPRSNASQNLQLTIRRITLAPGAIWELETSKSLFADRGIVSGMVRTRDDTGYTFDIEGPSSFGLTDNNLAAIENIGDSDAVLIELSASSTAQVLPKVPEAITADVVGLTTYTTLSGQGAMFILTRAVGHQIASAEVNSSTFPTILGVVESGSFRWSADLPILESTPGAGAGFTPGYYPAGSVIVSRPGGFSDLYANSDDSSILLLSVRTITPQDVAEWGESSAITSSGESMSLDIRTVTIQPGGEFSFRMDGSVLAWGLSGTASISSDLSIDAVAIVPELFSSATWATRFTISALGNQPATFVLARVSRDPIEELDNQSTTYNQSASGSVVMPRGIVDARLSLAFSSVRSSSFLDQEAQIALVTGGNFEFTPITEMNVNTAGEPQILAPFSDSINLTTGDSYIAEPGDSFGLISLDWESQIIKLTLTLRPSAGPGSSTPVPASSTPQANVPINVRSSECAIEPRSLNAYISILATPYALGNEAVNHRGDRTGNPASPIQIEGIVETMRQLVACGRFGSSLYQVFSVYSEAQLRFLASIGQVDQESIIEAANDAQDGGNSPPFTSEILIAEPEQFDDGRVGAWISSYGEIAYVTFVNEGGQWLIDFWDDSAPPATPTP